MRTRRAALVVAVAGAALIASWAAGFFRGAPPVYDGLPLNAEPYRYLQPPPGFAATAPPTSARQTITVTRPDAGTATYLTTAEVPPQASLVVATSDFPNAGAQVTVNIAAVPPPTRPNRGRIDGNVYDFSATSATAPGGASTPVPVAPGQTLTVVLRQTGSPGTPAVERLDGHQWQPLPTTHVPPAQYTARTDRLGDFALVIPTRTTSTASAGAGPGVVVGAVIGGAIVVLGGLLLLLRRSRRRGAPGAGHGAT